MTPDYADKHSVIKRVPIRGREESERQRTCGHGSRVGRDVGPLAKKCRQPIEVRKGKNMGSFLESPEKMQPCQSHFKFLTSRTVRE